MGDRAAGPVGGCLWRPASHRRPGSGNHWLRLAFVRLDSRPDYEPAEIEQVNASRHPRNLWIAAGSTTHHLEGQQVSDLSLPVHVKMHPRLRGRIELRRMIRALQRIEAWSI